MKKIWLDRKGIGASIKIIAIAMVAVLVFVAVIMVIAGQDEEPEIAPDKDEDGDGKPDPIIGFISVTAVAELDNRGWLYTDYHRNLADLRGEFISGSNNDLSFFKNMDIVPREEQLKVKFIVSTDYSATQMTDEVSFSMNVGSLGYSTKEIMPNATFYIRYPGTYVVTAILMNGDGIELDRKTIYVEA